MPCYVAVEITIHDPATYEEYKALAAPTIGAHGGRYVVRGGTTATMEGTWDPQRFVLLEFPDAATARAWWASPGYTAARAIRERCASTQMLLIDGPAYDPRPGAPAA